MSTFSLSEIDGIGLDTLTVSALRGLVDAACRDMKSTFDGREAEIEDWANGGWRGPSYFRSNYGDWNDHAFWKIEMIQRFTKLVEAFARREAAEIERLLATRHAA